MSSTSILRGKYREGGTLAAAQQNGGARYEAHCRKSPCRKALTVEKPLEGVEQGCLLVSHLSLPAPENLTDTLKIAQITTEYVVQCL